MLEDFSRYFEPYELKAAANRLARSATPEQVAETLDQLGMTDETGKRRGAREQRKPAGIPLPDASYMKGRHVGIWERQADGGPFIRQAARFDEWHLWANVGRIPAPRAGRRVVLLGESVARGYLFDPQYTPAQALQSMLAAHMGQGQVEVIDLARTNMTIYQMRVLAREALRLEPDVVVIFAGNNWLGAGFRDSTVSDLAAALRDSGVMGLKSTMEMVHRETVHNAVRAIRELYEATRVHLVWVMPEFNLGDWRDPQTNAPWLAGNQNQVWLENWAKARQALAAGDTAAAAQWAGKMVEVDGKTNATSLQFLAACSREAGDLEAARSYLELARDALIWSPFVKTPRPYSVTHQALRDEASAGLDLVDLPRLFRAHAGPIPDRRLFLDYCHLTAEGIQVSMAAAASRVVRCLTGEDVPWCSMAAQNTAPDRRTQAEATFLAAIHNAHWRQPYERVRYLCRCALELEPELAEVIQYLADIQIRQSPILMCRSAEKIAELPFPVIRQYLLRWNHQQFDRVLLNAAADAMAAMGIDCRKKLDALRIEERSAARSPVELLDGYYASSIDQPLAKPEVVEEMGMSAVRADYYQAHSPESKFIFVGEAGVPLSLSLTFRLTPGAPKNLTAKVTVNDESALSVPVGPDWRNWEIALPGDVVRNGLNEVTIRWPALHGQLKAQWEAASGDLLAFVLPEFYPVFGEIHSFTVSRRAAWAVAMSGTP